MWIMRSCWNCEKRVTGPWVSRLTGQCLSRPGYEHNHVQKRARGGGRGRGAGRGGSNARSSQVRFAPNFSKPQLKHP